MGFYSHLPTAAKEGHDVAVGEFLDARLRRPDIRRVRRAPAALATERPAIVPQRTFQRAGRFAPQMSQALLFEYHMHGVVAQHGSIDHAAQLQRELHQSGLRLCECLASVGKRQQRLLGVLHWDCEASLERPVREGTGRHLLPSLEFLLLVGIDVAA